MRRGESFADQVRDPVTELVVTLRDKATPLAVKVMTDGERGVEFIAVMREVWRIYAISKEEDILPFLHTHFRPVYRGRLHHQPCPHLRRLLQLM